MSNRRIKAVETELAPQPVVRSLQPVVDITNPANWERLLAIDDLDPQTRETLNQLKFLSSDELRSLRPRRGPRWCDPY